MFFIWGKKNKTTSLWKITKWFNINSGSGKTALWGSLRQNIPELCSGTVTQAHLEMLWLPPLLQEGQRRVPAWLWASQRGRGAALCGSQLSCMSVTLVQSSPQEVWGGCLVQITLAPEWRSSTRAGWRSALFLAIPKDTAWIFDADMQSRHMLPLAQNEKMLG